ncbi:MAG: hypothetical protein QNJ58_15835 [Desulfobacterales bacterium]|nr:hypothetical protein [Desulfobacterales bacterium]
MKFVSPFIISAFDHHNLTVQVWARGSKVVVHVQSESIIDKPREKLNKDRDHEVRLAPVAKNCAAKLVNELK